MSSVGSVVPFNPAASAASTASAAHPNGLLRRNTSSSLRRGTMRNDSPNPAVRELGLAIASLQSHPILGKKYNLNPHSSKSFAGGMAFLWRKCSIEELSKIAKHKTAGGIKVGKEKLPKITKDQVENYRITADRIKNGLTEFSEFMTEKSTAQRSIHGSLIVLFRIKMADLIEESGGHWICNRDTNVEIVGWCEGQKFAHPLVETFGSTPGGRANMLAAIRHAWPAASPLPSPNPLSVVPSDDGGAASTAVSPTAALRASAMLAPETGCLDGCTIL